MFVLIEVDVGSDVSSIKIIVEKKGDYYILNGSKYWIINGGEVDVYVVFVVIDKLKGLCGILVFIVEKGYEGFYCGKKEDKMGIRVFFIIEFIFEDCKVFKENFLGCEGIGFIVVMKMFDRIWFGVVVMVVGIV